MALILVPTSINFLETVTILPPLTVLFEGKFVLDMEVLNKGITSIDSCATTE
jgi:hypothetical protein